MPTKENPPKLPPTPLEHLLAGVKTLDAGKHLARSTEDAFIQCCDYVRLRFPTDSESILKIKGTAGHLQALLGMEARSKARRKRAASRLGPRFRLHGL
jgi:hypothetical protein